MLAQKNLAADANDLSISNKEALCLWKHAPHILSFEELLSWFQLLAFTVLPGQVASFLHSLIRTVCISTDQSAYPLPQPDAGEQFYRVSCA